MLTLALLGIVAFLIAWNAGLTLWLWWLHRARKVTEGAQNPVAQQPTEAPAEEAQESAPTAPSSPPLRPIEVVPTEAQSALTARESEVTETPTPFYKFVEPIDESFLPEHREKPVTAPEPGSAADIPAPVARATIAPAAYPNPATRLVEELNALVAPFDLEAADRFDAAWEWRALSADNEGAISWNEGGPLWYIEFSPGDGVVIPALKVVQSWNKFYRDLGGAQAQRELGAAFELQPGETLAIVRAASASVSGDQITITQKGELSGI